MSKSYIKFGVILAVVNSLWMVILYLLGISHSIMGLGLLFLSLIFTIIFCVLSIKEERNNNGGYIEFGKAFTTGFLTLFISGLIGTAFYFLYILYIDPDYMAYMTKELPLNMASKFGAPDSQLDQMRDKLDAAEVPGLSAWEVIKKIIGSAISAAVFALIIGAIMKKNKPVISADQMQ